MKRVFSLLIGGLVCLISGNALDMGTGTPIEWTFKVAGHDNVSLLDGGMLAKRSGTIAGAINLPEKWITKNAGGTLRSTLSRGKLYAAAKIGISGKQINFCSADQRV